MACWRVLELSDVADDQQVPQLLIKANFSKKAYSIFITDLSNIWSEELGLDDIIKRTSQEDSPIEVSKQDTAQLDILLENVQKSLGGTEGAICSVTQNGAQAITLHTTIRLPEPLDALKWKFYLEKRSPAMLKDELVLPLLLSSRLQHERVSSLLGTIGEKDRAISRLLDQYESSNLDLAAAFPSIAGGKPGRRTVRREQAIRHVPALGPFSEAVWKSETGHEQDESFSSLSVFQEALSGCTAKVPSDMKSPEELDPWWTSLPTALKKTKLQPKSKPKPMRTKSPVPPKHQSSDEETEDEFETHEHFKARDPPKRLTVQRPSSPPKQKQNDESGGDSTEDEDLDAPSKSQDQIWTGGQTVSLSKAAPTKSKSPEPDSPVATKQASPIPKRAKGFRIGGRKAKQAVVKSQSPTPPEEPPIMDEPVKDSRITTAPKPKTARKPFKIGGKQKEPSTSESVSKAPSPPAESRGRYHASTPPYSEKGVAEPSTQPSRAATKTQASDAEEDEHEETAEEKAERRRQLLKRNMEEQAKKQAQKKKRRF
ncbi:XLF-domain-containing protein [Amniculicola lignicola CBS 123094]|uniref:Non-homologous end-joining factor 1 n=1 Tax=Amniculicola lignicola CBS 123094 TaxID=1392246 RepID=A0A6A5WMA9_9PLEO|nr:XLF-domain-containing protein [Amniculicola lignicola CBS 123094]